MLLVLLRHGTAEPWERHGEDARRSLVEKGEAEAKAAGRFARKMKWEPDLVLTSPLVRARQTAELFCEHAGFEAPCVERFLAAGMHPENALSHLGDYEGMSQVVIVGHEPDFSSLIAHLTGSPALQIKVGKGSLWGVECTRMVEGGGMIRFGLGARILKNVT